ncbi:hypothetical protein ACFLRT_05400 [Acidobacteriota bacterium]
MCVGVLDLVHGQHHILDVTQWAAVGWNPGEAVSQLVGPRILVGRKPDKPEHESHEEENECQDYYFDERPKQAVGSEDVLRNIDGQEDREWDHQQAHQPQAAGGLETLPVLRIFQVVCVPPPGFSFASQLMFHDQAAGCCTLFMVVGKNIAKILPGTKKKPKIFSPSGALLC